MLDIINYQGRKIAQLAEQLSDLREQHNALILETIVPLAETVSDLRRRLERAEHSLTTLPD